MTKWVADKTVLGLGWYRVRVPLRDFFSLHDRPGHLAIRGGPDDIAVEHSPSLLLQKQPGFNLDWSTSLSFDPARQYEEAGTVLWLNSTAYAALGVRGTGNGKLQVVLRRPTDGGKITVGQSVRQ